jgi:hypothetical protein
VFVRKRQVKSNGKVYEYYGLAETRRENGKVKQALLYNMKKHLTIEACIDDARRRLAYWEEQDQARLTAYAAMAGMRLDPDHVAKQRARMQEEINFLNDAAARVVTKAAVPSDLSLG